MNERFADEDEVPEDERPTLRRLPRRAPTERILEQAIEHHRRQLVVTIID